MNFRKDDWPEAMASVLEGHRLRGFVWGVSDCGMFASDVALAITGIDAAKAFRGRYTTERGAARALKRAGFVDVVDAFQATFPETIELPFARRGDIVVLLENGQRSLAVLDGGAIHAMTSGGMCIYPRDAALFAIKVGE